MVLPSNTKACDIKKKKQRQRHYSVIEEPQTQKAHRQRRRSVSREQKGSFKTGLSHVYEPSNIYDYSLHESDMTTPRIKSLSPNASMSIMNDQLQAVDSFTTTTPSNTSQDANYLLAMLRDNEAYLTTLQHSMALNIPIQSEVIISFVRNVHTVIGCTDTKHRLPYFCMEMILPQQILAMGINPIVRSPPSLTLIL